MSNAILSRFADSGRDPASAREVFGRCAVICSAGSELERKSSFGGSSLTGEGFLELSDWMISSVL